MATKAGVWIDHQQAIVVLISDDGQEIKKIKSAAKQNAGGARTSNKYTPNDFIAEDRRERKLVANHKKVYDEVIASILGADSLLVLGPGEAKGEFNKYIQAKKLRGVTVEVETADKLTDAQLAAKVKQHFVAERVPKSVAPKEPTTRAVTAAATKLAK